MNVGSYLQHKPLTPVQRYCEEMDKKMEGIAIVPIQQNNPKYDLRTHLENLTAEENENIEKLIEVASQIFGINKEQFSSDGEKVKKIIDQTATPSLQRVADEELLERAGNLKKVMKTVTKVFDQLLEVLNVELKNNDKVRKYPFITFDEAISAYHIWYQKHRPIFSWIKSTFKDVKTCLKKRIENDPEKSTTQTWGEYMTPKALYDPVQHKADTINTLKSLFSIKEDEDLNDFHSTTDKVSLCLQELLGVNKEYNLSKSFAKKDYCYLTYLRIKNVRTNAYGDDFKDVYMEEIDENGKTVRPYHYLKKPLETFAVSKKASENQ